MNRLLHEGNDRLRLGLDGELSALDPLEIDEVLDEALHRVGGTPDDPPVAVLPPFALGLGLDPEEQMGVQRDRVDGVLEVVRKQGRISSRSRTARSRSSSALLRSVTSRVTLENPRRPPSEPNTGVTVMSA